jgi:hypothetical protein
MGHKNNALMPKARPKPPKSTESGSLIARLMQLEFEKGMLKIDLNHARMQKKKVKGKPKFISGLKRLKHRIRCVERELTEVYGLMEKYPGKGGK